MCGAIQQQQQAKPWAGKDEEQTLTQVTCSLKTRFSKLPVIEQYRALAAWL